MANLKFSQFTEKTDPANVQFIVGYDGTSNVRITPDNIAKASSVNDVGIWFQTRVTSDNGVIHLEQMDGLQQTLLSIIFSKLILKI